MARSTVRLYSVVKALSINQACTTRDHLGNQKSGAALKLARPHLLLLLAVDVDCTPLRALLFYIPRLAALAGDDAWSSAVGSSVGSQRA